MSWRSGEWAETSALGRRNLGRVGRKTRRAQGSVSFATPIRAGFEPLSWRGDHGPSLRIEARSVFLGGITTHSAAQNRRGTAQTATTPSARRVFRPTDCGFSPTKAASPRRRYYGDGFAQAARRRAVRRARNSSSFCCCSGVRRGASPARVWSKASLFSCTVFCRTARSLSIAS